MRVLLLPFFLTLAALPALTQTLSLISGNGLIAQENLG
jgi:hypothetical protein